jgi:hypothetical protein
MYSSKMEKGGEVQSAERESRKREQPRRRQMMGV